MRCQTPARLPARWLVPAGVCVFLWGGTCHAQGSFPTETQITTDQAGLRPNNVYSPRLLYQTIAGKATLVMYFGGWYRTDPTKLPNDAIYRAVCSVPNACGVAQKVIDPVADGRGSAALVNNPSIVELHVGGQDYFVMYMTCVTGNDPNAGYTVQNNKIYYSTSFANDGKTWSVPKLLLDTAWLPSVTLDAQNHVILYANSNGNNNPNFLSRYDLGTGGTTVGAGQPVTNQYGIAYDKSR